MGLLQRVVDLGKDDPDTSRPVWGAAATVVGDSVYLYGTSRTSDGGFGWAVSVARTKLVDVTDQSKWRYWDGERWQRDAKRAAQLIGQDDGVSQTFSAAESVHPPAKMESDLSSSRSRSLSRS